MEKDITGAETQDELSRQQNDEQTENSTDTNAAHLAENAKSKRKHHDDHHVNRKYRIFSNHSSWGDSPHTNTSF